MRRFFVDRHEIAGDRVSFPAEVLQHLHVLRLRTGQQIELLDGSGGIILVEIDMLERRKGEGVVVSRRQELESAFPVHLLQALPKGDKIELVLQKGVELGVGRFTPVISGRSIPRSRKSDSRHQRWQRVVQEAARQSRRSVLPRLDAVDGLNTALQQVDASLRLMLWEDGAEPLSRVLPEEKPQSAAVLIGPEGGFGADEVELAKGSGFLPVSLGPRILRTETAGLAVVTLLQYLYGDLDRI